MSTPAHEAPSRGDSPAEAVEVRGAAALLGTRARGSGVVPAAAGALLAALVIAGLYYGRNILIPLALAVLLGFVLSPLVTRLRRLGLPRLLSVIAVTALALAVIGGSLAFMTREVRALSAELPTYQSTIKQKLRQLRDAVRAPGMFDGLTRTVDLVQDEAAKITAKPQTPARVQKVEIHEGDQSQMRNALQTLERVGAPLVDAGIVLVFMFLVLLDRLDLRDRLLRLMGGNLHLATDAMDEAGERISSYLIMQLWVNLSYGVPMAIGLWLIGIPGAFLWGVVAAVMRYVPYVGPMISAVFPLTLAFAVDPGWTLFFWTLGLIVALELLSNNVVEPWLYGSSTGLSAISLIVAATFWTALWGPAGLVMSTPLTVCLLVIGRYLPALQFLDVLLGSQPALDGPTRLYQRLLGGEVDEAVELGQELADEAGSFAAFCESSALPVLRMAVTDYQSVSTSEHRLRIITGVEAVLDELEELNPKPPAHGPAPVLCLGGKWEVDSLSARMLAHALSLEDTAAVHDAGLAHSAEALAQLPHKSPSTVCVALFSPEPLPSAKRVCRRVRRRWPNARIVLCLWNAAESTVADPGLAEQLGADALAASFVEAVLRTQQSLGAEATEWEEAPVPQNDLQRVRHLRSSGVLDAPELVELFDHAAKRAAAIFDVSAAMVSFIDEREHLALGFHGALRASVDGRDSEVTSAEQMRMPREHSMCAHVVGLDEVMVVPDVAKDPRFAANPHLRAMGLRFYAGAPLRLKRGGAIGSLCLLDTEPGEFSERDVKLLQGMAQDLMEAIAERADHPDVKAGEQEPQEEEKPSATVGQVLPSN